jgi:hypothetical protein
MITGLTAVINIIYNWFDVFENGFAQLILPYIEKNFTKTFLKRVIF